MAEGFTSLLEQARRGDGLARDAVYRLAYRRLRGIASALLRRERPGHTLQPTALVSELFLKLQRWEARFLNEDHFFSISARAMRQVLIDHSRLRMTPGRLADLLPGAHGGTAPEAGLAVRMVFEKLRTMDAAVAQTVWMRCVEGLTVREVSGIQGRDEWRVRADYDFGLEWMARRLEKRE